MLENGEGAEKGESVEYEPQHRFSALWKGQGQSKEGQ